MFSFRSGAGWRVPGPGHENRRRWTAAGHAGRNQPQIHAQPGKRPVRWHRNWLHPTNRHEDKKQKKKTLIDFMSSSCPPLRSSPLFASFPFIPSHLPLLSSTIKRKSSRWLKTFLIRKLYFSWGLSLRGRISVCAFAFFGLFVCVCACVVCLCMSLLSIIINNNKFVRHLWCSELTVSLLCERRWSVEMCVCVCVVHQCKDRRHWAKTFH